MRVFIGIPASEKIKAKAFEFCRQHQDLPGQWIKPKNLPQYQIALSNRYGAASLKFIKPGNLHITLVLPWEISQEAWNMEHEALKKQLQLAADEIRPFEIKFNKINFGPDDREPRLIWARGSASKQIDDLRLKIYEALGQTPDNRQFRLHITLARFRPEDFGHFALQRLDENINWKEKVKSFVLMQSHLSPQGAEYEVLAEFDLKR